ncbi:hypothetical protein C8R44DRAFT_738483 [Mycena epipterygia]|nr:hypothetical protein C8R44DRAFT_738483 [Mycena epipterygia]
MHRKRRLSTFTRCLATCNRRLHDSVHGPMLARKTASGVTAEPAQTLLIRDSEAAKGNACQCSPNSRHLTVDSAPVYTGRSSSSRSRYKAAGMTRSGAVGTQTSIHDVKRRMRSAKNIVDLQPLVRSGLLDPADESLELELLFLLGASGTARTAYDGSSSGNSFARRRSRAQHARQMQSRTVKASVKVLTLFDVSQVDLLEDYEFSASGNRANGARARSLPARRSCKAITTFKPSGVSRRRGRHLNYDEKFPDEKLKRVKPFTFSVANTNPAPNGAAAETTFWLDPFAPIFFAAFSHPRHLHLRRQAFELKLARTPQTACSFFTTVELGSLHFGDGRLECFLCATISDFLMERANAQTAFFDSAMSSTSREAEPRVRAREASLPGVLQGENHIQGVGGVSSTTTGRAQTLKRVKPFMFSVANAGPGGPTLLQVSAPHPSGSCSRAAGGCRWYLLRWMS